MTIRTKLLLILLCLIGIGPLRAQQVILQDSVVGNVHLTADKTYLIRGYVYIIDGATLTIDPGTILYGEKSTKGTLIAERGGKLIANGTPDKPIIFTSQLPAGQRASGDWGGIILCGRAPINQNNTDNGGLFQGGDAQIEGGPRTHYGGVQANDNSGSLQYVRIEFPGIALSPNNEINGLTMGGVGSGTTLDHIQVSYSGDDSYEWFGGVVNAKHMIAFKSLDDDWDTDFGFSGTVQFGVSMRDPNIADVSGSNGFESDNDNPPNYWAPRTRIMFCNMTVVGPQSDTSKTSNPLFNRGAHIRRNSLLSVYNSIFMGWPSGLLLDASGVTTAATNDTVQIRNCIWAGLHAGLGFTTNVAGFDPTAWYNTNGYGNRSYVQPSSVMLVDPFNQTVPDWRPMTNSPALINADFTNPRLANSVFTPVNYIGAFGPGPRWDSLWTNYDPQTTDYTAKPQQVATTVVFPTTVAGKTKDSAIVVVKNTGYEPVTITSVTLLDSSKFKLVGVTVPFGVIHNDSKSITVRFAPTDASTSSTTLRIVTSTGQTYNISISGTGAQPSPTLTVDNQHDFALVHVGESVVHTIDISNTGTATLSISNITITGANASEFTIVSGGNSGDIAPGQKQTVAISFAPTTPGDKTATLQFTHNAAGGGTKSVALLGKGIIVYGEDVLKDSITGNVTLTNDRTWLIRGYVYIVNGATLNIEPGTVIYGEKSTKGTLIVERGGKLNAKGTAKEPILFLSQQAPGQRTSGDWGGIILCGRAPINQNNTVNGGLFAGGDAQIEGGPRTHYGGTDVHDNSGDLEYIRIEFPGIPLSPNNEINGLTMGGVGDGTTIDHIQVSYSGDDSYEWFGGTVNIKHIIAYKGLDDDFDTDFGFSGHVQFGLGLRDPNIADVSGSNGFESDNDNPPNFWNPRTAAVFSNMTVLGPQSDTSKVCNPLFNRGAHIRRNSQLSICNSIVMGWPSGLLLDATGVVNGAKADTVMLHNDIWAGLRGSNGFTTNVAGFDPAAWFRTAAYGNLDFVQPADVKLTDPFNQGPTPNFTPATGSPALSGASFSATKLSDPFFDQVTYRGAFGSGPRWDSGWTNYDPQNIVYAPNPQLAVTDVTFPTTVPGTTRDTTVSVLLKNTGTVVLQVSAWGLLDSSLFNIIGGNAPFSVKAGDSKAISLRFKPTAEGSFTTKLRFTFVTHEDAEEVTINGVASTNDVRAEQTGEAVQLFQNTPNPFNGTTSISYYLPNPSYTTLDIIDITGKRIAQPVNAFQEMGLHTVSFNGEGLSTGSYLVRLTAGSSVLTKQIIISR